MRNTLIFILLSAALSSFAATPDQTELKAVRAETKAARAELAALQAPRKLAKAKADLAKAQEALRVERAKAGPTH